MTYETKSVYSARDGRTARAQEPKKLPALVEQLKTHALHQLTSLLAGMLDHALQVVNVAVHVAIGEQADEV